MGVESFNIMALVEQASIVREKEYYFINGSSIVPYKNFELELEKLANKKDYFWILDECIEIIGYHSNEFFQGMEIRGCFSYLDKGIDLCFELIDTISKKVIPLKVYILNQEVEVENAGQLDEWIRLLYKDKITVFQKYYGNIQFKVTCSEFYKGIKKRNKWSTINKFLKNLFNYRQI